MNILEGRVGQHKLIIEEQLIYAVNSYNIKVVGKDINRLNLNGSLLSLGSYQCVETKGSQSPKQVPGLRFYPVQIITRVEFNICYTISVRVIHRFVNTVFPHETYKYFRTNRLRLSTLK
jgi:hypothetical protein